MNLIINFNNIIIMATDTFQGWARPVDTPIPGINEHADHTFVYCTNQNSYFKCFSTADIHAEGAVLCVTSTGKKAFCKADKYRCGILGLPDTAGLGYGLTGVCHQAANRFMYATETYTSYPEGKSRPRGYSSSCVLYGKWGLDFYNSFLPFLYAQAYARCLFAHMGHTAMQGLSPDSLDYKLLDYYQMQHVTGNNPPHPVADELEIVIRHTLGTDEPAELKQTHIGILGQMQKTFADYSLTALPNGEPSVRLPAGDVRQLVEKINKLSLEMQKEMKKVLGDEAFIRLNGDDKFYLPVNPEIALNILGK